MDILESMKRRHSVRQYKDIPIEADLVAALNEEIDAINKESGLHFQLILNEPKAFDSFMAHYGRFTGVSNYIALVGKKSKDLQERCGYFGERLVMKAHEMGLHTCWVALTYKKIPGVIKIDKGEALTVVISIGHGKNRGLARKTKTCEEVSNVSVSSPEWFRLGVEAALTAPTAMNQQKFYLTYADGNVTAKALLGPYSKMDLGIVKYHFEMVTNKKI
ncbi:MAG: nitroreductase [Ruminococcaceae bacterium]|nr:nitroreductase [Oscillospiraceae bacterium]